MKNLKIKWWEPEVGSKEIKKIKEVIKINYTNEGYFVGKLEQKFKKLFKVKYAVATTSGTSALFLSLKAIGVKKGDEVIVPNITFVATANAVKLTGAKVILVDVTADWCITCQFNKLNVLSIHDNKIIHIENNSFTGLTSFKKLWLYKNNILQPMPQCFIPLEFSTLEKTK